MTRSLRPLVVLAMAASTITGCGSSTPSETTTSTGSTKKAAAQAKGVKFSECMRGNGVSDFPDPNAKGEYEYGVSVTPQVFGKAVKACKALQPPGSLSSKRTPKEQSASLLFAQCVRKHGVKDFPDPVNGEPLINTYKIPSSNQPGGMAILNGATNTCKAELDKALEGK